MNRSIHNNLNRLSFVTLQVMFGLLCAPLPNAVGGSDQLAMNQIFVDEFVAENLKAVEQHASQLEPDEQYRFLSEWVLPGATHDTLRLAGQFNRADFWPLNLKLHCPALDLIEVAGKLEKLPELREQVIDLPDSMTSKHRRARATMLFLVELTRGDIDAARQASERLASLFENSSDPDEDDRWPLIVAAFVGIQTPHGHSLVADLLSEVNSRQLNLTTGSQSPSAWDEQMAALHGLRLLRSHHKTLINVKQSSLLDNWLAADIVTARSNAEGWPASFWIRQQQTLRAVASHRQSLLFYLQPLRGNFDVSCEVPSSQLGDISLMYGGIHTAPLGKPLQSRTGNILNERLEPFDPPMTPPDEWTWCRIQVRNRICTISFNGRVAYQSTLPADHDPWLAIRTKSSRQQPVVRHLRIDGTPEIPDKVDLLADPALSGWWPYFDDESDAENTWQHTVDESGRRLLAESDPEFTGTHKESLLCYYRPLANGESLEYEFFHEPGVDSVYPSLNGLAFLLQADGIALHQITNGRLERNGLDPIARTTHPLDRQVLQTLPLKESEWNQCRLNIKQDSVDIFLNGQLVYSHPIRTANGNVTKQQTFGFFRYAGESRTQIRNVFWHKATATKSFSEIVHQVVSQASHPLDERLDDLTVFEHDFTTDDLPSELFESPAGSSVSINVSSNGVEHCQTSGGSWSDSSIAPSFDLYGDFDFTASFTDLQVTEPEYGGCGIVLRTDDGNVVLLSRRKRKGNLHRVYLTWRVPAGDGEFRFNKDVLITEAPAGRLRMARRGNTYHFLVAENDSPVYRQVLEQTVDGGEHQSVRMELRMIASLGSSTSAIWKNLRLAAEQIKQFRFHASGNEISKDQWATISAADGLLELIIDGTEITDDDLGRLSMNSELRLLYLKSTPVTSAGVRNLSHLTQLEHLHLTLTRTDDSAAKTLGNFFNLKTLGLSYTQVGDATARELSRLKKLEVLGLKDTRITDVSIDSLSKMTSLTSIDLRETRITADGLKRLRTALPACRIQSE